MLTPARVEIVDESGQTWIAPGALGMSARNLQRHLAGEGTSFKELLDEARLGLAKTYVDEGRLSVTEVAFVLGFADTSAFSRAFKRWTGASPRDYATRHRTRQASSDSR